MRILLQELEIRRFLTTNYDGEIERALEELGVTPPEGNGASRPDTIASGPELRSLTFDIDRPDELLRFSTGAPGYEYGVFHLHGRYDKPETLIVTERDYQRIYLQEHPAYRAYRDALDLALSANAILFVGVGMQEADLLRPLRQFLSQQPRFGEERPIFALLPRDPEHPKISRELLYRFGVKTIHYDLRISENDDPVRHTKHYAISYPS